MDEKNEMVQKEQEMFPPKPATDSGGDPPAVSDEKRDSAMDGEGEENRLKAPVTFIGFLIIGLMALGFSVLFLYNILTFAFDMPIMLLYALISGAFFIIGIRFLLDLFKK